MKASEIREKSVEELNADLLELRKEEFSLRMQKSTGQLGQSHHFKRIRADIARIKTVITEKAKES